MKFAGKIRYWNPEKSSGLVVVDIPSRLVEPLRGLKQMKVKGKLNGAEYESNMMPAGGGRLALGVSQKMLKAGNTTVGKTAEFEIERRNQGDSRGCL